MNINEFNDDYLNDLKKIKLYFFLVMLTSTC